MAPSRTRVHCTKDTFSSDNTTEHLSLMKEFVLFTMENIHPFDVSRVNYCKIINSWNAKFSGILLKHVGDHLSVLFQFA